MNAVVIGNLTIPYELKREHRKTFAAHVYPDGKIIIKAPTEATEKEAAGFVHRKSSWIAKQINYFRQFNKNKKLDLSNGSEHFHLGRQYQMIVKQANIREYVELNKTNMIVYCVFPKNLNRVRAIYDFWLAQTAEKEFNLSLHRCLKKFPEVARPKLRIKKMLRRWGSHIKPNTIILNQSLIYTSKKCIDYVVIHELCHYYHKDHSSAFYSLLGSKMPNWARIKDELEQSAYLTHGD
jgi:predicted metal-dependent hydrolase